MKIKHHSGNKTDREKLAKTILLARARGEPLPSELKFNIPPGTFKLVLKETSLTVSDDEIEVLERACAERFEAWAKNRELPERSRLPARGPNEDN